MKKTVLLMIIAMMASVMSLSAKKQTATPEGHRVVLKAAADFNSVTVNAPVTVELIKDPQHIGYIVYHSTVKGELKVFNKGTNLIIDVKDNTDTKNLHVTSRVVVCYDGDINSVAVNGAGTLLSKGLDVSEDMTCVVNGSGDIKIGDMSVAKSLKCSVNGTGDVDMKTVTAKSVSCTVNGSGDIDMKSLKAESFAGAVNGSGDLDVKGSAANVTLSLNGSGDVNVGSLQAESAVVNAAGSGDVHCRASRSLKIKAKDSCDVHVHGSRPANVEGINDNVHISGK